MTHFTFADGGTVTPSKVVQTTLAPLRKTIERSGPGRVWSFHRWGGGRILYFREADQVLFYVRQHNGKKKRPSRQADFDAFAAGAGCKVYLLGDDT